MAWWIEHKTGMGLWQWWYHHNMTILSPCGTATAQAFSNIAFIKFTGHTPIELTTKCIFDANWFLADVLFSQVVRV
jgi:hypothetical protein